MSASPISKPFEQPAEFAFTPENKAKADAVIAKYPEGRQASAVLALLDLAQRQHDGWVPQAAIEEIADILGMAKIRVMEVSTFFTMINLAPIGKFHIQLCGTTPCMLRGSEDVEAAIREEVGIGSGETSDDGLFTVTEVECLGACVNAPMVQINDDFYEDLTKDNFMEVLRALKRGEQPKTGSQIGRHSSEPEGGAKVLTSEIELPKKRVETKVAEPESNAEVETTPKSADESEAGSSLDDAARPEALSAPEGDKDDLKRISGVGPKIEGILNGLGIFHFKQVAAWTQDNADWIDGYLSFKGRIERENWIEQARTLAAEGHE